ncbi:MAG: hypothetical protein R6U96_00875 [Promethearchaeia archaeon]
MDNKQFNIVYVIGLAVTSLLMVWILFAGETSLNFTFLVFFWVVRFLSGFGLVLAVARGFLLLLDKAGNKLGKKGTNVLIVIEIIIPVFLIGYGIYKIMSSYAARAVITQTGLLLWFDNIIYIYGIASLLLNLYIIPLISEQFQKAVELGKASSIKKGAKKVARKVKKKYFTLRKKYAKAQVQDQMTVRDILDLWRNKFSVILLLVLSIGAFLFMPVAFVCVMFWLRLYVFFRNPTQRFEKIFLLISMIFIGLVASIASLPFIQFGLLNELFTSIEYYYWTVDLFYLVGICIATFIFVKKLLNLQGITLRALKMWRKEKKIDQLTQEKEQLKRQLEEKKE